MHECQEIRSANINQKEDRFLIYERDLMVIFINYLFFNSLSLISPAKYKPDLQVPAQFSHLSFTSV